MRVLIAEDDIAIRELLLDTLARQGYAGLTAREVEVLRLLARGLSNKQVAERLVISPKTVGNHVEHIYAKIGVSTRAAAGLFATEHGLLAFADGAVPRGDAGASPAQ